jgi:transcriptional regulator with XRE-family HTH domain
MTPLERQYALKKKGIHQCQIAEDVGVSEYHVSAVIRGERISDRVMKAIAKAIGEDHRLVFPQYYLRSLKRKTSKPRPA